jgi:hypothetical protein
VLQLGVKQGKDWHDEQGTLWACDDVLRRKFPSAMRGAKHLKLMAYRHELPGTVKVRPCSYSRDTVLVEEFDSSLGTTVMKEHDAHPALVKWLNSAGVPDPVYIGVSTTARHQVEPAPKVPLYKGRSCRGATPMLHLGAGDSWQDKDGAAWVCADAVQALVPWVQDSDTIQLLAFGTPSGPHESHTVELKLQDQFKYNHWPLLVDGVETYSHDALRTWLSESYMPKPAHVTVHVVGKVQKR